MTDDTQPEALRALAEAAKWTGKWYDAGCNTVYCTYDKEDSILHDEIAHPVPFGVSEYIAAAHPQAVIALLDRIAELESELEAVGAGGVQPLCKQVAPQTQAAPDERAAFEKWLRVKPCGAAHDFGWEAWRARAALAATYPTQQGLELANCKGGKWLTVVYRDIQPGDESRTIGEHPKVSALSWSHALHDRDAALAAKGKQGPAPGCTTGADTGANTPVGKSSG